MDCAKELNKVLVQVQALELVKERFNAGKPESKKMKIKTHYPKLFTASLTGKTADFVKAMDELIDPESLLYEVVGDQEAIDKGSVAFSKVESNDKFWQREFYQKFNKETVAKKEDIIMAYMRLNSLYEEAGLFDKKGNAEKAFELRMEAEKLMQDISSYATRTGQFIQGLSMLKRVYGGKKTDSIVKTINNNTYNANRPKAKIEANKTIEDAKKDRADGIVKTVEKIISPIEEPNIEPIINKFDEEIKSSPTAETVVQPKPRKKKSKAETTGKQQEVVEEIVPPTIEELLSAKIRKDINKKQKTETAKTKEDNVLSYLYSVYMDSMHPKSKKESPSAEDKFKALTEIMLNKNLYDQVWRDAKEIVGEFAEGTDDLQPYFDLLNPLYRDKIIKDVVKMTLKSLNVNLTQMTKSFYGDQKYKSVSEFMDNLKSMLEKSIGDKVSNYDFNFLFNQVYKELTDQMASKKAYLDELALKRAMDAATKKAKKRITPAEILAKRFENLFKESTAKTQNEITRMVNRLYQKASEAKQTNVTEKKSQFEALAEIILNRGEYNELWNSAWDIASKSLDQNTEFAKYFMPFQDFAASDKFLQSIVRATLKQANAKKPISQWSKEYFLDSNSSITNFVNALNQSLMQDNEGVEFTEAQLDYAKQYVLKEFEKTMVAKREELQNRFNNKISKTGKLKPISKTTRQRLVNQLVDAMFYDALDTVGINKTWAERFGVNPELSPEQIAKIRSKIIELTNEKDPEKLEIEVDKLIDDLTKGAPADLLTSFRVSIKAGMLASSRVWLNNVVGNYSVIPYYITMDAVKQGVFRSIKSVYKGAKLPRLYGDKIRLTFTEKDDIGRAVNQHANLEAIQYHLRQTEKFDIVSIGRANQVLFGSVMNADYAKWFDNAIRLPFRAMTSWKFIGDQTPFQFHYRYAFGNKLSALRYKESLSEEQKADMIQTARDYAIDIALTRTFRKMYKVAKIYNSAKSKNKVVQFIADISVPFINTGVAMSVEAYKFSPYALPEILVRTGVMIKNPTARTPENIDKVASLASQSLVGTTAMFSIGLLLGSLGMLDLDYPDDEKEREMWKTQGRQPYSIKAPWGSYTLDWINPLGTTMFYGAALGKALSDIEDDDTLDEVLKTAFDEGVLGSLNRFIDQSFVGQLRDDFGSGSIEEVGGNIGASFASQLIPAPMKIIANATDPYERITYIKGELGTTTWYKALGSVPVTRTGVLPIAYDVWGNKIKRAPSSNVLGRVGGAVLSLLPGRAGFEQTDALTDEVYKIYEESNKTAALPPVASSTITRNVNGVTQTVKLTLEDYSEYQRLLGESNREQAEKTIRRFNSTMSAEAKAKKLDSAYSKGKEKIRDQFFSEYGFD